MPKVKFALKSKRGSLLVLACLLAICFCLYCLYLLDQRLHRKFDTISSLNEAGYRGPVVGSKQPDEKRILLMGGSTAAGYGVFPDQTISAHLEQLLNNNARSPGRYTVINLGFNSNGAGALTWDLNHYSFLQPDVVIFYTGYDDLKANSFSGRQESWVFRLTGYYPILPLIVSEKAKLIRYHSWGRWSNSKPVFRSGKKASLPQPSVPSSRPDWSHYCEGIKRAINYALNQNTKVLVVTEPYLSIEHIDQQRALREMLETEFKSETRVTYVNLGTALNSTDEAVRVDSLHLNSSGNRIIAEHLVSVIQKNFP